MLASSGLPICGDSIGIDYLHWVAQNCGARGQKNSPSEQDFYNHRFQNFPTRQERHLHWTKGRSGSVGAAPTELSSVLDSTAIKIALRTELIHLPVSGLGDRSERRPYWRPLTTTDRSDSPPEI